MRTSNQSSVTDIEVLEDLRLGACRVPAGAARFVDPRLHDVGQGPGLLGAAPDVVQRPKILRFGLRGLPEQGGAGDELEPLDRPPVGHLRKTREPQIRLASAPIGRTPLCPSDTGLEWLTASDVSSTTSSDQ